MIDLSCINLLQGTDSDREFSRGNTLPIVARPWGMHHWTLQTGRSPWTFNRRARRLQGVRLTHQPSPWMRDYCSLTFIPFTGEVQGSPEHQASAYRVEDAELQPHQLKVDLLRYGVTLELTPTERGALARMRFREGEVPRLAFYFDGEHALDQRGNDSLSGYSRDHRDELCEAFRMYFRIVFSVEPTRFVKTEWGGYVEFAQGTEVVEMRLGGSFVSGELAAQTVARELAGRSFGDLATEGKARWQELLGRVQITTSSPEQYAKFYSCLYRCLIFPRFIDEPDANGAPIHRSPVDGQVHVGPMCTDSGFWDAYRTLYPLLALVYPDVLNRMMQGWLNTCRQAGWAPMWLSPGPRVCMIGTHFDIVSADAVCKGVRDWGVEEAFTYLWKNATQPSTNPHFGRVGLEEYIKYGYVPADRFSHGASCTLDYAYDDFAVAQVARYLGKDEEAAQLMQRSQNYRNVFDPSVGFMRGRKTSGDWAGPFHPYRWGGDYIEGGPWQHVFNVPHDHVGLAECFGGAGALCQKLDQMLGSEPRFEAGTYGYEIHEATEMALAGFGQYAHSNQPVHAFLFLYGLMGERQKMEHWVRRVCDELYTLDDFPGDEDNGEMSAWYIWATLGLFPYCPGKPEYLGFTSLLEDWCLSIGDREIASSDIAAMVTEENGGIVAHEAMLGVRYRL